MTASRQDVLAVAFRDREPYAVWINPAFAARGSSAVIVAVLQLWREGAANVAPLKSLATTRGVDDFCASHRVVDLVGNLPDDAESVIVESDARVRGGRSGIRRLPVEKAASTAAATLLRSWRGTIDGERLAGALSALDWDARAAYLEYALYGVPYADHTQPVTYYRTTRERSSAPTTPMDSTGRALVEAEAAANELLFVACVNAFRALEGAADSVFDSTFGVQVARAITTKANLFRDDEEFLWRLAAVTAAGRRWRLAEREAGGQDPLGVAKIREALGKSLHEYGGPDQAFVNDSHLGEIALRAFFDAVPTSAGSRGTRIPGQVFLYAGFAWAIDETDDIRLTYAQRNLLWSAFRAGVTYCDTQYFVDFLNQSTQPPDAGIKLCPDCAEEVKAAARKCRFCGYEFRTAA